MSQTRRKYKKRQQAITIRVTEPLPWMPPDIRRLNIVHPVHKAERLVYRRRKQIPVSRWAEQHIMVTLGPLVGTKWRNSTAQYLAGIMDASFFFSVGEVVICAADQVGKTRCVDNCLGYAIDRAPGPVLTIYPDENTTKENVRDSLLPMITQSPRLRTYLTGAFDDEGIKRIGLKHMQIYTAWAHSATQLANRSIKYVKFDETDKYPETAGKKEADPISKGEKRTRTFKYSGRKVWKSSTPSIETGFIWQALNACQVIFDYFVCCPDCGHKQKMAFNNIRAPEKIHDPERIENENLAWYACEACGSKWTDPKRDAAVRLGEWRARPRSSEMTGGRSPLTVDRSPGEASDNGERTTDNGSQDESLELTAYLKKYRPKKIGFHLPSWLSHFVGLSEVMAAWFRGQINTNDLKDFQNSHAAEPWKFYAHERAEDKILALRDDRPRGIVPGGGWVSCLTAGVDTQDNGFWYEIRAWGWGPTTESWQVSEGFLDSFTALDEVVFHTSYFDDNGNEYFVRFTVHDAMGHHTSEVYEFATRHPNRMYPFQGKGSLTQPIAFSAPKYFPGTKIRIPGNILLMRGDVNFFKNELAAKLTISPEDPGAWHLHAETTVEWARQMCAEVIDEKKGIWINPHERPNHGWDCSVYNLVAAMYLRVRQSVPNRPKPPERKSPEKQERPSWLPKGSSWLKR